MPALPIDEWIVALGTFYDQFGYLVVFAGTLFENTALLGLVLPGNSLGLLGAFYAREGTLNLGWVIFFAWLGTVLGYNADYLLGRYALIHVMARWSKSRIGQRLRLAALVLARAQLQRVHAEARANELALREANQRMEQFLGIICHELKTPLTIMKGSLQLAERKVKRLVSVEALSPDEMRRFAPVQALMERARNQIVVQDRLVNDLLDASRVQTHTLRLLLAPCNLVSVVQEAIEDQRQINPARTLNVQLPAQEMVNVHADADRLVQVVTNYLTNALKYSPPDQPVDVCLSIEGAVAQVSVRDRGPGLPPEEQERIWERFYRAPGIEVQGAASVSNVGLGVGLYVCRTIIELHAGQVGVQSRPGAGSTFWLALPLARQDCIDELE